MVLNKISVPRTVTLQKQHLFKPGMIAVPIVERVPSLDYLDTFDRKCLNDKVDEINIIFISVLKGITFSHYMTQPRSMLCRKLERNFIEDDYGDFDYNWLPNCFRHNYSIFYYLSGDNRRCSILSKQTRFYW